MRAYKGTEPGQLTLTSQRAIRCHVKKKYKTEGSMLGAVLLLGDWLGISQCFLHHLFSKYVHIYMNSTGPRADS